MGSLPGVAAAVACTLVSVASAAASLEDVQACLAANVPKQSSALTVKLESRRPGNPVARHESRISWRRSPEGLSETLICMSHPPGIRGLAYLILEKEDRSVIWGYLPEAQKVIRVHAQKAASRARIARTAIDYEDLRYLPLNVSAATLEQEPTSSELDGRKVFGVQLSLPPGPESPYARIVSSLDRESCVPLRTEFYDDTGELRKTITADAASISQEGGIRLARSSTIRDLANEVETDVRIEKVEIDSELPEQMFTPRYLKRGRCL